MTVIWKPPMPTYITRVFCNINFNNSKTHLQFSDWLCQLWTFQLFHASNLTSYHFYFEVLISLRPEVNNLYVYIILLSQSCSYNKIPEPHNHERTATYWIFNILFRDVNRSINRLKLKIEKENGLLVELEENDLW